MGNDALRPGHATVVSCGIFRPEIEHLARQGRFPWPVRFLESMLHMTPSLLEAEITRLIGSLDDGPVVLLFGDCHARMSEHGSLPGVRRVRGVNCCEILLGPERYHRMLRDGVFFLLPEWISRWEDVFIRRLGFADSRLAAQFMGEMHTRITYLDTGVTAVPLVELERIGHFLGLPVTVEAVDAAALVRVVEESTGDGGADC